MREDIRGGLRNALERGENLEQAVRSFINAGYPESEVRQTAQEMTSGAQPQPTNTLNNQKIKSNSPQISQQKPKIKKKTDWKLIILGVSLLFLILILVISIWLKDQIIKFFGG